MKSHKFHIALICCLLISAGAYSQFLGGDGDGYNYTSTGFITINEQDIYCFGGDADGHSISSFSAAINTQEFYCSGGDADGYQMSSSGIVIQNEQGFYCSGGDEDGFSTASFLSQLNVQNFYCSGGVGDGFGLESSPFSNPNIQNFYCSGGNGDGYSVASFLSILNEQDFYCSGGNGDGFDMGSSPLLTPNNQQFYCSGGDKDGFSVASYYSQLNEQDFYCNGGNGDGFHMQFSGIITPNDASIYCSGGNGDGYNYEGVAATINTQNFYCEGGNGDGYDYELFNGSIFGSHLFCLGGDGDGFGQNISPELTFGIGIWTGLTSNDWNTSTNWTHTTIPGATDNVNIPADCPNYPLVTQTMGINFKYSMIKCQRLDISAGASLSHTNRFYIYGEMLVEGNYISTSSLEYVFRIYSGGLVTIPSSGTVTLGNQTSGAGISDLLIYSGGILNLQGGILEIDDQIRVRSGGTFNMTNGELFVHKYGEGSAFSSSFTGNLVIESGALGGVSGGTVKICGKESVGDYHAFNVLEPTFDFTGTSTISFQHGVSATHYNCGIYAVDGVTFQNLVIDKPGNTVFFESNLDIENGLNIEAGSAMKIESGNQITVGP